MTVGRIKHSISSFLFFLSVSPHFSAGFCYAGRSPRVYVDQYFMDTSSLGLEYKLSSCGNYFSHDGDKEPSAYIVYEILLIM